MLPVYVLTNVALPVFVRKFYPTEFSPIVHVLFPIVSSAIFIVGIWLNIHPWPAEPMTSFPIIVLAVVVAAALWGAWLQRSGSPLFHQLGRVLFMEGDAQPHLEDVA
jgi:hypothetical protein